jgi:type II secretory pathway pseudopilin PulG
MTTVSMAIVVLLALILLPVLIMNNAGRRDEFLARCQAAVEGQGGRVLSAERKLWGRGPFWVKGKNQFIARVIFEDGSGARRQLWARSRTIFRDDEFVWDYDDGSGE